MLPGIFNSTTSGWIKNGQTNIERDIVSDRLTTAFMAKGCGNVQSLWTVNNNKKVISTLLAQLNRNKKPYGKLTHTGIKMNSKKSSFKKWRKTKIIFLFSFAMSAIKLKQKL